MANHGGPTGEDEREGEREEVWVFPKEARVHIHDILEGFGDGVVSKLVNIITVSAGHTGCT